MKSFHPFASALLQWFAAHGRQLPWRGGHDPYAIWLSEVILQQTRIEQGRSYWLRFMERWPRVELLAQATEDEVLRLWQGLGYYSRARHLHEAARQVVAMGGFPHTVEELRRLSGVGDYTAAAIASLAFGAHAAVVDGNVYRVLARHFGIATPIDSTAGKHEFAALARELLPEGREADFNQAMMDFGATCCTPQAPRCAECPLAASCAALLQGRVGQLPVKERAVRMKERRMQYAYIRWNGQTALRRRGAGDIWQGLWEPLLAEAPAQLPALPGRLTLLREGVRHVLTHRVLLASFFLLECVQEPPLPEGYVWLPESRRDDYAVPRLVEMLFEAADAAATPKPPSGGHNAHNEAGAPKKD